MGTLLDSTKIVKHEQLYGDTLIGFTPQEGLEVHHHPEFIAPACWCGETINRLTDDHYTVGGELYCSWGCIPPALQPIEMRKARELA